LSVASARIERAELPVQRKRTLNAVIRELPPRIYHTKENAA